MSSKKPEISDAQIRSTAMDLVQGIIRLEDVPYEVRKGVAKLFAKSLNMDLGQAPPLPELKKDELRGLVDRMPLERMYEENIRTLEQFKLADRTPPSLRKVIDSFSSRDFAIAKDFQQASLVLIPPDVTFFDLEERLDSKMVVDLYRQTQPEGHSYNDYRAVLVDGGTCMDPYDYDTLSEPLANRRTLVQQGRHPEERGMTREIYMMMAMQSLVTRRFIDERTFTVLDEDQASSDYYIPTAGFNNERPSFYWVPPDVNFAGRARFRNVVGGNMPVDGGLGFGFIQKARRLIGR